MDVIAPPMPAMDFGFTSSPVSYYSSAPSSPTRLPEYCEFDELFLAAGAHHGGSGSGSGSGSSVAAVPFAWEEKPGVPKTPTSSFFQDDFSFDVSPKFGSVSVPADDLFAGGVIKTADGIHEDRERGRERGFSSSRLPSSRSRRARSLSPLGASNHRREQPTTTGTKPTTTPACSSENVSKRWSFRDLFLFRSASDGSAMDKYPLKKSHWTVNRKNDPELRKSGDQSGSISKRRGRVSAHEVHYNLNRANSNELKKKTYLPYKQGILGGFSFT